MRDYELVMAISPQVADDQVSAVTDRVTQFIKDHGGAVKEMKPWGRRRLAYHIKDFQEGSFVQATFSLATEHVAELQTNLRISEDVVRFMLTEYSPPKPRPVKARK